MIDYGKSLEHFSRTLRERRKALGLSRHKFSKICGIGDSSLRMWENRNNGPTMYNMIQIANAFGCTLDELIGLDRTESRFSRSEEQQDEAWGDGE